MMIAPPQFPQLQFAADGAVLPQSTADTITAWDAEKQGSLLLDVRANASQATVLQFFPETTPVTALAFHPGGNWIAALLKYGVINLWAIDTGQQICIRK